MISHKFSIANRGNIEIDSTVEIKMLEIDSLEHV